MARSRKWLVRVMVLLWAVQLIWLGRYFGREAVELFEMAAQGRAGAAVRQEDPYYRWLCALVGIIPPSAAYIFVDDYQAGKEIEARYHLTPRRHVLLPPEVPPSFIFYAVRQEKAAFVIIRDQGKPPEAGVRAALNSPAFQQLQVPGPGLVLRVDSSRLRGEFYD